MPPKRNSIGDGDAATATGLSGNELRFLKAIFDNMTQKPDADWSKVAEDVKLKDAKCAKERFRQMSVRHGWRSSFAAAATGDGPGKVVKKPRTPRKKKEEKEDQDVKGEDDVKEAFDEESC